MGLQLPGSRESPPLGIGVIQPTYHREGNLFCVKDSLKKWVNSTIKTEKGSWTISELIL